MFEKNRINRNKTDNKAKSDNKNVDITLFILNNSNGHIEWEQQKTVRTIHTINKVYHLHFLFLNFSSIFLTKIKLLLYFNLKLYYKYKKFLYLGD